MTPTVLVTRLSIAFSTTLALSLPQGFAQTVQLQPIDPHAFDTKPKNLQATPVNPGPSKSVQVINEFDILSNTLNGPATSRTQVIYFKPIGEYATVKTSDDIRIIRFLMRGTTEAKAAAVRKVLSAPGRFSPPVLFAVSAALMQQNRQDEGFFFYLAADLRAKYDAERCADDSARSGISSLSATFAPVQYFRNNASKLYPVLQKVIEWDTNTPYDYDNRWINMHGLKAFAEKGNLDPLSFPKSEWPLIQERTRKSFLQTYKKIAAVQMRIDLVSNLSAAGDVPRPAIVKAALNNNIDSVKSELDKGASVAGADRSGDTALHCAAHSANLDMILLLLKRGASVNAKNSTEATPLHVAAQHEMATRANRQAFDPGLRWSLSSAAKADAKVLPCIMALLQANADPNLATIDGYTPLLMAAEGGCTQSCKALLQHGAIAETYDVMGQTALFATARHGDLEVCKLLLAAGAAADTTNIRGYTPLLCAAEGPYPEIVELLLSKGANPKVKGPGGQTPLMIAVNAGSHAEGPAIRERQVRTASLLLAAGTDPNEGAQCFGTPLPSAASQGNLPLVRLLIDHGARINEGDDLQHWTALHYASSNGDLEMTKFLLSKGADTHAMSSEKKSPAELAKGEQSEEIKSLLQH